MSKLVHKTPTSDYEIASKRRRKATCDTSEEENSPNEAAVVIEGTIHMKGFLS